MQLCRRTHKSTHTHASPGFGRGAVELVLGVQRPHRLAADSMIHKRAKERASKREREKGREKGGEKVLVKKSVSEREKPGR